MLSSCSLKRILLTTLLMTVIAFGVSYLYPPVYSANGSFLVKSKKIPKDPEALERAELRPQSVEEQDLYSEMEILTSREVMRGGAKNEYPCYSFHKGGQHWRKVEGCNS